MWSHSGTSVRERRAGLSARWRTHRNVAVALSGGAVLVWLLVFATFETSDSAGVHRDRTAAFAWRAAALRVESATADVPAGYLFSAALVITAAGMFALVWAALRVRDAAEPHSETKSSDNRAAIRDAVPYIRRLLDSETVSTITARPAAFTMVVAAAYVAWTLGAFSLLPSGGVADSLASVDHPFHISRAETLRRSLLDGESLRWVANHQGGYPAEFYPFGLSYAAVLVWILSVGTIAVPAAHKLVVVALFLLPGIVYWRMAVRDRWPPVVAVTAFAAHLLIPGGIWHGGYSELVYLGLAANVAAALAGLAALVAMTHALTSDTRRSVAVAALLAAAALWMNPRSAVGLIACGAAAWIAAVTTVRTWTGARVAAVRLGAIALLAALLAAPEIVSLARFGNLYYFVRHTAYGSSTEYLAASIEAVSVPVFLLALCGIPAGLLGCGRAVTRATVVALLIYAVMTLVFALAGDALSMLPQLEATRLMPLQRYLIIYLAAIGLHVVARTAAARLERGPRFVDVVQVGALAALMLAVVAASGLFEPHARAPRHLERTNAPAIASYWKAMEIAHVTVPTDAAILVIGSEVSTHQQLWGPSVVNRLFFYDNWMWYWHTNHVGPYDPLRTAWYDSTRIDEVLSPEYLHRNAIGGVVVAGEASKVAEKSPALHRVGDGVYTPYLVLDRTSIVTVGGQRPASTIVRNHTIEVETGRAEGDVLIRRNWFPRWRATVDGRPVAIKRTDDGYMQTYVPHAGANLRLEYVLDGIDWTGRGAACLGSGAILFLLVSAGKVRRPLPAAPLLVRPSWLDPPSV